MKAKPIQASLIALMLLASQVAFGQGIHAGMVRTQGTLALGSGFDQKELRYYVYGEAEYLLSDHVGFNGSAFANIGSNKKQFDTDGVIGADADLGVHNIFCGPVWHPISGKALDLNISIQPGLALLTAPGTEFGILPARPPLRGVAPVSSLNLGAAYYGSFFHLFAQVRGIAGRFENSNYRQGLGEVRFTFGLGFNFL